VQVRKLLGAGSKRVNYDSWFFYLVILCYGLDRWWRILGLLFNVQRVRPTQQFSILRT